MKRDEDFRLQDLTQLDHGQRQLLINYYAKLGESTRIEAHKLQTDLARQQPRNGKRDPVFFHGMLLLALSRMKYLETSQAMRSAETDEEIGKITKIRADRIKDTRKARTAPVRRKVELKYFHMIRKFREKNGEDFMSWQMISDYIARYHKERIPRSTLRRCYNQVFEERKIRGEL